MPMCQAGSHSRISSTIGGALHCLLLVVMKTLLLPWDTVPNHGYGFPPHDITGTVEMLFAGAPSISLRLMAR
ncbi:MAG: hypothetical protein FD118_1195 [Rhodocyclaceae bacterium]|nr:MAG: hypothetical protein FD118_1195 [Rhodocyclaceae bacterium]